MNRIAQIQSFLEQSPNDPFLHHALALEYLKIEDLKNAKSEFEFNLTYNQEYVGTYYHYGKLVEADDLENAKSIYEKGITIALNAKDIHAAQELKTALAGVQIILDNV